MPTWKAPEAKKAADRPSYEEDERFFKLLWLAAELDIMFYFDFYCQEIFQCDSVFDLTRSQRETLEIKVREEICAAAIELGYYPHDGRDLQ